MANDDATIASMAADDVTTSTSFLKTLEDVATSLLYLHESNPPTVHVILMPSNVLLSLDFESCLVDYAFISSLHLLLPTSSHDLVAPSSLVASSSFFYHALKSRIPKPSFTPLLDVYNFGILLLELLIRRTSLPRPTREARC
ncbi:hypothetical protein BHM03_00049166 [Ensete ventricosum]|nr:hypothetical protein BHM03_00049166 [Ensete ventricosum]